MALTSGAAVQMLADNYLVPAWTIIGGTAVLTALNTYELSLSLMKRR